MMRRMLFLLGFALFLPVVSSADDLDWSLFNTRIDEAEIIFSGTVISKEYRDSSSEYGGVFTVYKFDVHEEFKGESPDGTLIVRTHGGASPSGKGAFSSSGSAAFSLGGDYLLFMAGFGNTRQVVVPGGVMVIGVGPISGNLVLLKSGWQVLDFDENGPVFGNGPITGADQTDLDMGILFVDDEELVGEVTVNFVLLLEKFRRHITSRKKENTYKPSKKVDHATGIN